MTGKTEQATQPMTITIEPDRDRRNREMAVSRAEAFTHPLDVAPTGGCYLRADGTPVDANGTPIAEPAPETR